MVTVTVNASWRLGHIEINTPYNMSGNIHGRSEVLLQEVLEPMPEAKILRGPKMTPFEDGDDKTYGVMSGVPVDRKIDAVLEDTIEMPGGTVSFSAVLDALNMFFEKWRVEDENKPPPGMPFMGAPVMQPPKPPMPPPVTPMPPVPPGQTVQARTRDNGEYPDGPPGADR